jgi:hypothetical protein
MSKHSEAKASAPAFSARARWAALVPICLAVAVVYGSLLRAPALTWDDQLNIFENPYFVRGLWATLWTKPYFGMYVPAINTVWAGLLHVGDGAAWPFRLLNLALHLVNVVLFATLLRALLRRFELENDLAVIVAAAIFALHPVQTAAVSWISGSRDLAATAFAFAAIGVYFRNRRGANAWSTLLFVAGLLCKPQIAGVPLAIALYVWMFEREQFRRAATVMGVWSAAVLASTVVTLVAQAEAPAVRVPLLHRPAIALDAMGFYLIKLVWPFPLAADYGRTPGVVWSEPHRMVPTFAALALAAALLWWGVRRDGAYRIALTWPIILLPVLGLVTFGYQRISTVADHYTYLPLAVCATVAAIAVARARWSLRRTAWALPALVVLIAGILSWRRNDVWRDDDRFYADMLAKNPASFSAQINLAANYCDRGDWRSGLALVERSATQASDDPGFLANKAYCLYKAGRFDEVLSLQVNLRSGIVRNGFTRNQRAGAVFATSVAGSFDKQGQVLRAFAYLCQAQALTPEDETLSAAIDDIRREFQSRGRNVGCPGLLPWDTLERVVTELR